MAALQDFGDEVRLERAVIAREDPAGEAEAVVPVEAIPLVAPTFQHPKARVARLGPSYRVHVAPLGLVLTFRDVRTSGELGADLAVEYRGAHLFRTTSTLSLTGREKVAKVAHEMAGELVPEHFKRAVFAAVEAVLEAEESLGRPIDLREAGMAIPDGSAHVVEPLWPTGSMILVSPGAAGKSTIARALAVSLASGSVVIPGLAPLGEPRPVLFVAAEDPIAHWHSRSVEAICRGAGLERRSLSQPIELFDARGRPLHRIARAVAERAADFGAVILDSQQALIGPSDNGLGIRDRDTQFWAAIDQLGPPVCLIAHPNRADSKAWDKADGRIAGSEVNADRARMAWRVTWKDLPAVTGTSYRRYSMENTKNSHGPKEGPIEFAASWTFGFDGDPGRLTFERVEPESYSRTLSPELQAALDAYRAGHRTPAPLAATLGIPFNTAKSRLRLLGEKGYLND